MTKCKYCNSDEKHDRRVCRMKKLHTDPEFAARNSERASEGMKKLHADPEFAARHSERMKKLHADPKFNPLASLTSSERSDYDVLKKAGYSRKKAFAVMGLKK